MPAPSHPACNPVDPPARPALRTVLALLPAAAILALLLAGLAL